MQEADQATSIDQIVYRIPVHKPSLHYLSDGDDGGEVVAVVKRGHGVVYRPNGAVWSEKTSTEELFRSISRLKRREMIVGWTLPTIFLTVEMAVVVAVVYSLLS